MSKLNGLLEQEKVTRTPSCESTRFPRASVAALQCSKSEFSEYHCPVICESTFTIVVDGKPLSHLQCSNNALPELAYGFLFNEGVISGLEDVTSFNLDPVHLVATFGLAQPLSTEPVPVRSSGFGGFTLAGVEPRDEAPSGIVFQGDQGGFALRKASQEGQGGLGEASSQVLPQDNQGGIFASSVFRKSSVLGEPQGSLSEISASSVTMADVTYAITTMQSFAREYTITRGIHCSALFADRVPLASFEDIGRHNTFDKLAGASLLQGFSTRGSLLATTGRISSEMVHKAHRLGVAGVVSLSGPTDQAAGMFLAGYVRGDSGVIYTR